jgi:hypothetical protein
MSAPILTSSAGGQLPQGEGDWPHGSLVAVRLVAEAERRVSHLELVRALEEADDNLCRHGTTTGVLDCVVVKALKKLSGG